MGYDTELLAKSLLSRVATNPRVRLKALARTFAIDRHTANRALVRHFGKSFRCLQRECSRGRIRAALTESGRMFKEIAPDLGYASTAALARRVRQLEGCTPSELRILMACADNTATTETLAAPSVGGRKAASSTFRRNCQGLVPADSVPIAECAAPMAKPDE